MHNSYHILFCRLYFSEIHFNELKSTAIKKRKKNLIPCPQNMNDFRKYGELIFSIIKYIEHCLKAIEIVNKITFQNFKC